ncbi:MAG TPA: response regulator [Mucilaginibacter sp.]|jgi:CheY-like chemotaxis protein|nr:response regulator [Mucilaginibacter sp.]
MSKLTYIDDCRLDQFILRKLLNRYGFPFEVNCVDTSEEALVELKRQCLRRENLPDIILLDIYNPYLDAWNFLDRIQALYPILAKPVEVFVLSASKYPTDVERLKQYGFVKAYILKPITKEALQQLIYTKEVFQSKFLTLEAQN